MKKENFEEIDMICKIQLAKNKPLFFEQIFEKLVKEEPES